MKTKGFFLLALSLLLGLVLRLAVWRWHTFYPLGGDEQEYFNQALVLLRDHRYTELRLMRPPLYGVFLAGCILLVDSLVERLRLIQALISTATMIPVWLLTAELARLRTPRTSGEAPPRTRAPAIAALLCGLSYTLAARATELLTETLFLLGLTTLFWLLVRAGTAPRQRRLLAALAGLMVGVLCLVRSVALPLVPAGALWLFLSRVQRRAGEDSGQRVWNVQQAFIFVLAALLIILPWTIRNDVVYGGVIVIDTTGAENLWLDNDPAGRDAVKAQLYALGDDRLARQQIAMQRGVATIVSHPQHVIGKAWRELVSFFALEYSDDMRARQAIWVPSLEVWARLVLGDGLFLLILLCGAAALWSPPHTPIPNNPRWLFAVWALYTLLTALLFHVELRYRLPLVPVLIPYTALGCEQWLQRKRGQQPSQWRGWARRLVGAILPSTLILCLTLLHAPYPALAWQLGWKHLHLARADYALEQGNIPTAEQEAQAARSLDPDSVLARVALAQAALLAHERERAETLLHEAVAVLPAHPYAHLLLGDIRRQQGRLSEAAQELRYETSSLQDLQAWCWQHCSTPPPPMLDIGNGLDLGFIRGFHASSPVEAWRWTTDHAWVRLAVSPLSPTLRLRMASGRPADAPPARVTVMVQGETLASLSVTPGWNDYTLPLPPAAGAGTLVVELISDTFTPRMYDPTSSDGRVLGVMVSHASTEGDGQR